MIKKIVFLLMLCLGFSVLGQENLIYQQIQNEKINGEKFSLVQGVFTKDKLNSEVTREFKDVKEVSFFQFNANAIPHTERSFSFELPLNNKTIVLELVAVDDDFYDYVVATDKGEVFSANRDIKHYRGVVKGDKNSLVAISFFGDEVGGIIANDEGNFNLETVKKQKGIIFYKDTNLIKQPVFECTTEDDEDTADYDPTVLQQKSKLAIQGAAQKCVRIYFETEYDIYQDKGSLLGVESYISTIFNQVALLYQNENIKTAISIMRIWTSNDIFTATTTKDLLNQFQTHHGSYFPNYFMANSDLGQLLTFRSVGGGKAAGFDGLCRGYSYSSKLSVSQLYSSAIINTNYTWNVSVITHEFGHLLGSRHTHACVWNGNSTAIDNCGSHYKYINGESPSNIEGFNCYSSSNPILPSVSGGTIMSYCHLNNVGINFNNGFGLQPGNVIRNKVANASCLRDCDVYCFKNLITTSNVPLGAFDFRQVAENITSTNKIALGGIAFYYGNTIHLKSGFRASEGSIFNGRVLPCEASPGYYPDSYNIVNNIILDIKPDIEQDNLAPSLQLYPNPTSGLTTIVSDKLIISWELFNEIGHLIDSKKIDYLKEFQIDMGYLKKGLYLIRFTMEDGVIENQKVIKK